MRGRFYGRRMLLHFRRRGGTRAGGPAAGHDKQEQRKNERSQTRHNGLLEPNSRWRAPESRMERGDQSNGGDAFGMSGYLPVLLDPIATR
ncbi:hypothetical protein NITLEN_80040 [Nitrospira lenta]|uniref:Uncharacterized protein n=1 Tax=Nitrospira lenta TaxID=1436998 RepID=A0A330L9I7_9BACT|nr:hypothetical protein NITLEN_80040 [Nitrospira lenta]